MDYAIYLHIPFCRSRCSYCDFNTTTGQEDLIPAYIAAMMQEIEWVSQADRGNLPAKNMLNVSSIYFGGGTPSLLPVEYVERVLLTLQQSFALRPTVEISFEANPGSIDISYLQRLQAAGVNRLSLGVQSSHREELQLMGRGHSYADVVRSVQSARQAGFVNLSLDLIFGLPGHSLHSWEKSVRDILLLEPEHLSLYALSLHPGTSMAKRADQGLIPDLDDDLAADMYELADDLLGASGYAQYEISNWARRSTSDGNNHFLFASQYNLQTWRNAPYLGFGAGAHGSANLVRYSNVQKPGDYIQRIVGGGMTTFPTSSAVFETEELDTDREISDTMILGLRLLDEGVQRDDFHRRFGVRLSQCFNKAFRELGEAGLIDIDLRGVRLSRKGRFVANRVFQYFI